MFRTFLFVFPVRGGQGREQEFQSGGGGGGYARGGGGGGSFHRGEEGVFGGGGILGVGGAKSPPRYCRPQLFCNTTTFAAELNLLRITSKIVALKTLDMLDLLRRSYKNDIACFQPSLEVTSKEIRANGTFFLEYYIFTTDQQILMGLQVDIMQDETA